MTTSTVVKTTIRPVTRSDAPAIVSMVEALARHEGDSAAAFDETAFIRDYITRPKAHMLLAIQGDNPIGFIQYSEGYDLFTASPGAQMGDIFVHKQWRGEGIGKALMQACAEGVLDAGGTWMAWSLDSKNAKALNFYQSLGAATMQGTQRMALGKSGLVKLLSMDATL